MVAGDYTVIKFHSKNVKREKRGFRLHFSEIPRSGKCRREPSVIQLYGNNPQFLIYLARKQKPFDSTGVSEDWTPSKLMAVI